MPAYFNISLQFERKDIYKTFVKDFYAILEKAGMKFKGGCWNSKNNTLEEICKWNQKKLEENFEIGFTEHCSHDFKQVMFDFGNYSHVRGFWLNKYPDDNTFSFEIIIPESDVLVFEGKLEFQQDKIKELLELAKKIWQFPYIRTIQTGLEGNDASTKLINLTNGFEPNVTPFSIVEEKYNCFDNEKYQVEEIFRNGILLRIGK